MSYKALDSDGFMEKFSQTFTAQIILTYKHVLVHRKDRVGSVSFQEATIPTPLIPDGDSTERTASSARGEILKFSITVYEINK